MANKRMVYQNFDLEDGLDDISPAHLSYFFYNLNPSGIYNCGNGELSYKCIPIVCRTYRKFRFSLVYFLISCQGLCRGLKVGDFNFTKSITDNNYYNQYKCKVSSNMIFNIS